MEEEKSQQTSPETLEHEPDDVSSSDPVLEDDEPSVEDEQEVAQGDTSEIEGELTHDDVNDDDVPSDTSIQTLEIEINQLKKEKDELYNRMLRIQAEYDNFKKRTQKERIAERKYKAQDLANELLPVMDNFERALQVESTEETKSIIEGISMVYNQLKEALKSQGVEEIEAEGNPFDPNLHHAVMQVEDEEQESNIVVEELQKGYILNDRVIRPAMVKVNK